MSKSIVLKLTSAIVVDGEVMPKDSLVELSEAEAKNLLHRGKAVLHDVQPASDEDTDITKMNKDQLIDIANQMEIDGADKMTKAQLIEAITAAGEAE
ncbi:hypothetical protein MQ4_06 [Serratia phage MQ-4]|nr:hypothetical protein MQ4_06 [Serratia phage MQ-4]